MIGERLSLNRHPFPSCVELSCTRASLQPGSELSLTLGSSFLASFFWLCYSLNHHALFGRTTPCAIIIPCCAGRLGLTRDARRFRPPQALCLASSLCFRGLDVCDQLPLPAPARCGWQIWFVLLALCRLGALAVPPDQSSQIPTPSSRAPTRPGRTVRAASTCRVWSC